MVRTWNNSTADEQEAIGHEFALQEAIRLYSSDEQKTKPKSSTIRPTSHELALYLQGQGNLSSKVLLPLLQRDAVLKRKFEWLLSHYALVSVPSAAAAASTAAVLERPLPDGGSLQIIPSNANSQQVHLVIELPAFLQNKEPHYLFIRLGYNTYSLTLPSPLDGKVMQLMSIDNPAIIALRNAQSTLDLV
ncbi:MAG: hypothetical protein L3J26_09945 [Candidatus Polarisedimenticolaceae bacterium]|nr:hypothetical protein [Candidatus Polarisedimenticolaceae bacterium]